MHEACDKYERRWEEQTELQAKGTTAVHWPAREEQGRNEKSWKSMVDRYPRETRDGGARGRRARSNKLLHNSYIRPRVTYAVLPCHRGKEKGHAKALRPKLDALYRCSRQRHRLAQFTTRGRVPQAHRPILAARGQYQGPAGGCRRQGDAAYGPSVTHTRKPHRPSSGQVEDLHRASPTNSKQGGAAIGGGPCGDGARKGGIRGQWAAGMTARGRLPHPDGVVSAAAEEDWAAWAAWGPIRQGHGHQSLDLR
jgi:hypothetical protein